MKIALLQCNAVNGDLQGNADRIKKQALQAAEQGASLCSVPAQALCGPDVQYYMKQADFQAACGQVLTYMSRELPAGPAVLCSLPIAPGMAILIQGGEYAAVGPIFCFGGKRFEIRTEESAQTPDLHGVDVLLDMAATPFSPDSTPLHAANLQDAAYRTGVWALSVNLAGGFGGVIYQGQSLAYAPGGKLAARAKPFAEDVLVVDIESGDGRIEPDCANLEEAQWQALVLGTRDFLRKAGASKAILGLSGGMDSALVACVAKEALGGENVTGILMPSPHTSRESITDALELAGNLHMETFTLPIDGLMGMYAKTLAEFMEKTPASAGDLTQENLQARIRGVLLMAAANRSGALVLNTGNKSEAAMGYCTLYGDTVGALAVIGDLLKTRVYELGRWYCQMKGRMVIPENIFTRPPTAELRPDQKDTDSLPPYHELDPVLEAILAGAPCATVATSLGYEEIRNRVFANQFKRNQMPQPLLVSGRPLGLRPAAGCSPLHVPPRI